MVDRSWRSKVEGRRSLTVDRGSRIDDIIGAAASAADPEPSSQGGRPRGTRKFIKISDGFNKIMIFAVWATPWPPKGDLRRPKAARGCPGWVSRGSRGSPGGPPRKSGGHFEVDGDPPGPLLGHQ